MDKPSGEVKRLLGLNEHVTSIDASYEGKDAHRQLVDRLKDEAAADPANRIRDHNIQSSLSRWLEKLSGKQRAVVERRFGLHDHKSSTLEGVAQEPWA